MLTLYGHPTRTAANILKIRAALAEAGAEYAYSVVDLAKGEQHRPEYLAINPHGKVPVLVDDDFTLPESDAILWYVAEKYPSARLLPNEPRGRARVHQWCDFASTSLYASSYELYLHTSWAEPANRSAWAADRARTSLGRALGVLDKRLAGREHVATDELSIADYAVAAAVHMLRTRSHLTQGAHPSVDRHYERIAARSAFVRASSDSP